MNPPATALEDAGIRVLDCEHKTPPAQETGNPYIAIPDIQDGRVLLDQARRISDADLAEWTRRTTPMEGDVIVTRRGRVGDTAPVPAGRVAIGQNLVLLRTDGTVAEAAYLRWAVRSPEWWAEVDRLMNVGAVFSSLNVKDIGRIRLSFPPLPEQQAIAEVLGALDDKIAANTRLAAAAESLLRAEIDARWLKNPERDALLSDYVALNPPTKLASTEGETAYIDMKKLPEAGWSITGLEHRPAKGGARFTNGDTLVARITPCLENRKTGFVDTLDEDEVAIGSTEFIVMRPVDGIAAPIAFLLATESRFREHAIQHMVGTSGRQRVSANDLANFEMPAPDATWLAEFGTFATSVFDAVRLTQEESRTLAATRDALLPKLMSGEIRVKGVESIISEVL